MSTQNKQQYGLELELQEVVSSEFDGPVASAAELELLLVNSAFGYEYAMEALKGEECPASAMNLQSEVEGFRENYFDARLKLDQMDRARLKRIESELSAQKLVVFAQQNTLH